MKCFLIIFLLVLTGCSSINFNKLSKEEISQLSYDDLCNPYSIKNDVVKAEMNTRGVKCDYYYDVCKASMDLDPKSPEFTQCINSFRQQGMQQFQQGMNELQEQQDLRRELTYAKPSSFQKTINTSCQPNGFGGFNCHSY